MGLAHSCCRDGVRKKPAEQRRRLMDRNARGPAVPWVSERSHQHRGTGRRHGPCSLALDKQERSGRWPQHGPPGGPSSVTASKEERQTWADGRKAATPGTRAALTLPPASLCLARHVPSAAGPSPKPPALEDRAPGMPWGQPSSPRCGVHFRTDRHVAGSGDASVAGISQVAPWESARFNREGSAVSRPLPPPTPPWRRHRHTDS